MCRWTPNNQWTLNLNKQLKINTPISNKETSVPSAGRCDFLLVIQLF
jgi:hypothetical protein